MRRVDNYHYTDQAGNPDGGCSTGQGFTISWQRGLVKDEAPNGAFLEDVLTACLDRLQFYQQLGKLSCEENSKAIAGLHTALGALNSRQLRRENQEVANTTEPHDSKLNKRSEKRAKQYRGQIGRITTRATVLAKKAEKDDELRQALQTKLAEIHEELDLLEAVHDDGSS